MNSQIDSSQAAQNLVQITAQEFGAKCQSKPEVSADIIIQRLSLAIGVQIPRQ